MKALTLMQPWTTLIAIGAKKIETRSWSTRYRGSLAIHAAQGFPGWAKRFCEARIVCGALGWPMCPFSGMDQSWCDEMKRLIGTLPRGAVIATCTLVDCISTTGVEPVNEQERAFGDYSPGRYAWMLNNVQQTEPILAKGALGLWEWKETS